MSVVVKTSLMVQVLSNLERYLLFLLIFYPEFTDADALFRVMKAKVKGGSGKQVGKLCERLVAAGFLITNHRGRTYFYLGCAFESTALQDLLESAARGNWWPGYNDVHEGFRTYGSSPRTITVDMSVSVAELLRMFCGDTSREPSNALRRTLAGTRGDELLRAVAWTAHRIFKDEPAFTPSLLKTPALPVLPLWMNLRFAHGASVNQTMAFLREVLPSAPEVPETLVVTYAALALWMGRGDEVQALPTGEGGATRAALQAIARRDFAAAQKSIVAYAEAPGMDDFAVRLLLAMATVAARPEKPPKTRVIKLLRGPSLETYGYHRSAAAYCTRIQETGRDLADRWKSVAEGTGNLLAAWSDASHPTPAEALMLAWGYRLAARRARLRTAAERLADEARQWAAQGYLTLVHLILTLLHGGFDPAAFAPVFAALEGHAIPFLEPIEPPPEWQETLAAIEKAIGKKKATATEERRLVWHLDLIGKDEDLAVESVHPALRNAGDPEDGRNDATYDRYDFRAEKWRELMSTGDWLLWKTLETDLYYEPGRECVRALVGLPNLYCYSAPMHYGRRANDSLTPLEIRRGELKLETQFTEDGGRILSLPKWALGDWEGKWRLRRVKPGVCEFLELSKQQEKLIDLFREQGSDGRLILPPESLAQAEKVLSRMAEIVPFAEKTVDGETVLPRVAAETALNVRLAFTDNILRIHPVVLPLKDNPNMTFDPGVGQAEKMIVGAVRSYVLVRDLAAEAAAFAPVAKALEGAANWFDGQSRWTIDDLPAALGALSALKAVTPALTLEWQEGRRLNVTNAPKSGVTLRSTRTAEDWFRVEGDFKLDDGRVLGIMELVEAMANRAGDYVRLSDGDYVALTQAMQRQIAALKCAARRKGDGLEVVKAAVPMLDGVFGEGADSLALPPAMAATAEEIRAAFAKRPQPPVTLNAELRPYQRDGYRWLSRLAACGFGACLADDMGLGKTVQVIALLLERAANGASLVFAPSSVCGNWRRELRRFAPTLNPLLPQEDLGCLAKAGPRDVVIASYGFLLFHEEAFAQVAWNGVILDEAQAIKNDASKRAKAVKRLKARFRVAATGTPVENRLGELWSLFDFLNPGLLGPAASFAARFTADGMAVPELKRLVKPLILRRLKGDVLDDLPAKTEVTLPIELGNAERTAYEACRRRALAALEGANGEPNRMSILAELTRLRRFCCHPSLVLGTNEVPSAKLEALAGLLEELKLSGHRALVFSQFTDYLAIVRKLITAHGWTHAYLDGSTPTLEREKLVNAFQAGEGDFFVISLKAGGTGLNLTAADYVILLDPWWNPAVENQAADRAHRIGQQRPVTVYRLIAQDTVEERVLELHKEKQAIAEDILEGTSAASLSPAQLMALFR